MARSGSVLLLLLLPLTSAVTINKYWDLGDHIFDPADMYKGRLPNITESECQRACDAVADLTHYFCSGYVYENGTTCVLQEDDCRRPDLDPSRSLVTRVPAPEGYLAKDTCPGTALNPCECPAGFHRYGARCLKMLDQKETFFKYASRQCLALGAHLVVPRFQQTNDEMIRAATELQKAPFSAVWIGVSLTYDYGPHIESGLYWRGEDDCWTLNTTVIAPFWASGHPVEEYTTWYSPRVIYSPPGETDSVGGWRVVRDGEGAPKTLCQLAYCYRPDCIDY